MIFINTNVCKKTPLNEQNVITEKMNDFSRWSDLIFSQDYFIKINKEIKPKPSTTTQSVKHHKKLQSCLLVTNSLSNKSFVYFKDSIL